MREIIVPPAKSIGSAPSAGMRSTIHGDPSDCARHAFASRVHRHADEDASALESLFENGKEEEEEGKSGKRTMCGQEERERRKRGFVTPSKAGGKQSDLRKEEKCL